MKPEGLHRRLTIEEAEAANLVSAEGLGPAPVPFGYCHDEWRSLVDAMREGDELWEFNSSPESWANLCGRSGYALVRADEIVQTFILSMN